MRVGGDCKDKICRQTRWEKNNPLSCFVKKWEHNVKIIDFTFSGEEEPLAEAQKVISEKKKHEKEPASEVENKKEPSQVEGDRSESQELGLGGPSPQQLNSIMHQVKIKKIDDLYHLA